MATEDVENLELTIQNAEQTADKPKEDDEIALAKFKQTLISKNFDADSVQSAITKYIAAINRSVYPAPFLDNVFPKDWHGHAVPADSPNLNFKARVKRATIIIVTPVIFITVASNQLVQMTDIIGGCLWAMFTLYFAQVFFYVFCAKGVDGERKLYRVYSTSDVPKDWTHLKTGYIQLLYREESIQSISELSAINGGVTKTMLNTLGAYTWCAILIHFVAQLYYEQAVFKWDPADICALVGTTGLLLISIFELDPFSARMQAMHYTGAGLGACCVVCYVLQQASIGEKLWFPIFIAVVVVIFASLWILVGIATDVAQIKSKAKYRPEYVDRIKEADAREAEVKISCLQPLVCGCLKGHTVNGYSKLNIVFEAVMLYLAAVSLCLFLIEYDREDGCWLGCSHGRNFDWSCFCPES